MKKLFFIIIVTLFILNTNAQDQTINGTTFKADGKVGIGTTNPQFALDVNSNQWAFTARLNQPSISTNSYNTLVFEGAMTSVRGYLGIGGAGVSDLSFKDAFAVGTQTTHHTFLNTNDIHRVKIDGITGDVAFYHSVGIGTTTPDEKLSVNGNIHAKEVRVDLNGWSDFVFKDNYNLPTLQEVESHIKDKGHLKDIPSAKEVAENGILLGEMDAKLLQKIEELTLYTIEQQKEINAQKEKIGKLEKENLMLQSVSKRIEQLERLIENLKK